MKWPTLLVCFLALIFLPLSAVTGAADALVPMELNIGFPATSFSTVNTADAKAAIRVWIDTVGRNRGYDLGGETKVFGQSTELFEEIRRDRLDLVIIKAWDYLDIKEERLLRPVYIPAGQNVDLDHYLLLVRRDSAIKTLADLRGADIALLLATGVNYSRPWIETHLEERGLGGIEALFSSVIEVDKISSAVLPVFFGKRDACVVDGSGFDAMQGMNPQVGRELTALAISAPLMETIICLHTKGHQYESELIEAIGELDEEPRGEQILMVFKINRLIPFDPVYLEGLSALRSRHLELVGTIEGQTKPDSSLESGVPVTRLNHRGKRATGLHGGSVGTTNE